MQSYFKFSRLQIHTILTSILTTSTFFSSTFATELTAKPSGGIQLDFNSASADTGNGDWSATELRRGRLGIVGQYGDTIKYQVVLNTNSSEKVDIANAYLQWTPTNAHWNIKIGHFKTQNSLDEQTSSRFISTLERAAFTDAFAFNRRLGVSINTKGKNHTFSVGAFTENISEISDKEGYALAARGTYTPINLNGNILHLGTSVRYRDQGDTQSNIRYRQRPYAHIPGRILSTGSIAESDTFLGFEAATIMNNFWAAGEYGLTHAKCAACTESPNFNGGYLEAGAFFGGRKTYKDGKFNRPKIDRSLTDGGIGAVSILARYDRVDLTDTGINGGAMDTTILDAGWYPVKNVRLGINYFNTDVDLGTSVSGLDSDFADLVGSQTKTGVNGFIIRTQFDF